jgi:CheY-like chemotaxis protein
MMTKKPLSKTPAAVLVVDDEAAVRELERRVLEAHGYVVTEAHNGGEGIAALVRQPEIDLLIADLDMPGLGGDEMVRQIRMMRPELPVLYVTGHIDRLMDVRLLWEGEAFLEKPFTAKGLQQAVSLLLYGTVGAQE